MMFSSFFRYPFLSLLFISPYGFLFLWSPVLPEFAWSRTRYDLRYLLCSSFVFSDDLCFFFFWVWEFNLLGFSHLVDDNGLVCFCRIFRQLVFLEVNRTNLRIFSGIFFHLRLWFSLLFEWINFSNLQLSLLMRR